MIGCDSDHRALAEHPLKAIAEFVENSIDAHATTITITRGKQHGAHYLAIKDDGDGVPRNEEGLPDFKYVTTHIGSEGLPDDDEQRGLAILQRMIELSLYAEERLKSG
jgi:hypothetical protein